MCVCRVGTCRSDGRAPSQRRSDKGDACSPIPDASRRRPRVAACGVCRVPVFSLSSRVCVAVCRGYLPLHHGRSEQRVRGGDKGAACRLPGRGQEKDESVVAAGGACCALFSLSSHMRSMPSPRPFPLAAVQDGKHAKGPRGEFRTRSRRSSKMEDGIRSAGITHGCPRH